MLTHVSNLLAKTHSHIYLGEHIQKENCPIEDADTPVSSIPIGWSCPSVQFRLVGHAKQMIMEDILYTALVYTFVHINQYHSNRHI